MTRGCLTTCIAFMHDKHIHHGASHQRKNMKKSINLGATVKDRLTGYKGVLVASSEYLDGTKSFGIQASVKADGDLPSIQWFDRRRVVLL